MEVSIGSAPTKADPQESQLQAPSTRRWLRRLANLRTELIVPYIILTLLIAMVGMFVVTRLVTSSIRERFVNQMVEASRVAADGVVRQEQRNLAALRLLVFTEGVAPALAQRDADELQKLLLPLALNNRSEVITAVDLDGREVLTLAYEPETKQYLAATSADFSQVELVTSILQGAADETGDKFAGLLTTPQGPYLFTSAPVQNAKNEVVGALLIGTRLSTLSADLKTQTSADVVLLDRQGQLLNTTLPEPEGGYGELERAAAAVGPIESAATHDLQLYGRGYQIAFTPLLIRQKTVGNVGVVLPSNYLIDTEATSRNTFSLIFAFITIAVIVLGYLLSTSIARPILRLRTLSQAVAAGDLNQKTQLDRPDEIGELAEAFDTMTQHLRERTDEAARLYAETVQRNAELAEINVRLQNAQQQLVQSEKLAAVGQLTAGIVHDVKNPLAVIKGLAESLQEEPELKPYAKKDLGVIRESATKANQIVSDLLTFSRQSTPEMKHQDLKATVEAALRITAYLTRKAQVQVIATLPEQTVYVTYDAQQVEQVLINLIQNAIQAMPQGGTLRVSLSQATEAIALAVQDTGVGIPPENLRRIFDPFFTTKPEGEGTGLGLSVGYGIIGRHHGRIDVESVVGEGTTFTILLPNRQPDTTA
ncbi:two-component system, NtrC family, sensor kinase [Thermoflexales bacterium]|nr:two-component system, NtrC family, sensor kinase [Thermoflexales bacterium]